MHVWIASAVRMILHACVNRIRSDVCIVCDACVHACVYVSYLVYDVCVAGACMYRI